MCARVWGRKTERQSRGGHEIIGDYSSNGLLEHLSILRDNRRWIMCLFICFFINHISAKLNFTSNKSLIYIYEKLSQQLLN